MSDERRVSTCNQGFIVLRPLSYSQALTCKVSAPMKCTHSDVASCDRTARWNLRLVAVFQIGYTHVARRWLNTVDLLSSYQRATATSTRLPKRSARPVQPSACARPTLA